MKKFLLGTTAIVAAAAVAAPAVAAEKINLGLGGYMNDWIGFTSNDTVRNAAGAKTHDYRNVNLQTDTEIWVQGSTTLDNGLKFAVRMEIEADGEDTAGTIDESYVDITSPSFGQLKLGYDDIATALAQIRAPSYGMGLGNGRQWIPVASGATSTTERHDIYTSVGTGDEAKITYFTPRFAGFQAGASYVPEMTDRIAYGDGAGNSSNKTFVPNAVGGGGTAWAVDLNYANTFGGFGMKAGVGYGHASGGSRRGGGVNGVAAVVDDGVRSIDGYQAGFLLSYAGFEVGAAWESTNLNVDPRQGYNYATSNSGGEHNAWEVAVGYKTGPWGVSLGYQTADTRPQVTLANQDMDTIQTVALEGIYNLGPGIDVAGSLYWVDYSRDSRIVSSTYNNGGWAFVMGTKLSF